MRSSCAPVLILAALLGPPAAEATERCLGLNHVRAVDRASARLVELGYRLSPTLQRLVDALEASNVIVYIEQRPMKTAGVGGFLALVENQTLPFVRIVLDRQLPHVQLLGLLGHELQHALEVAEADVRTRQELERLYEAIGFEGLANHSYDSPAARHVGEAVVHDLIAGTEVARASGNPEPGFNRSW